ncbi:hypothetical protein [Anatilimnocola floriformis]|uniref:hypothetical protein n=1 Tax=Anatilimnocola floriformis TaxID=2948575 RepID=UPI0020C44132|nr:hypothetical protein [Anatilimnocola floriformis]
MAKLCSKNGKLLRRNGKLLRAGPDGKCCCCKGSGPPAWKLCDYTDINPDILGSRNGGNYVEGAAETWGDLYRLYYTINQNVDPCVDPDLGAITPNPREFLSGLTQPGGKIGATVYGSDQDPLSVGLHYEGWEVASQSPILRSHFLTRCSA